MKKSLLIVLSLLVISSAIASIIYFSDASKDSASPEQEAQLSWDIISSGDVEILSWDIINSWNNQALSWALTAESNNPLIYTNTEFWFQLTLPKGWEDYKAFVYTSSKIPGWYIILTLPTSDNTANLDDPKDINSRPRNYEVDVKKVYWYAYMFAISLWSPKDYLPLYEQCKIQLNPWCVTDITTLWYNGKYYFVWNEAQEFPEDIRKKWGNYKYLEQITSTFKLI